MEKISIKNNDGSVEEANLINAFRITDLNKRFAILSKGEQAGDGMSKIYITEPGVYSLVGIKDEQVWSRVKQAMKEIVES